jgi:TolB-like protein/Tfp pilus assembly protein PilF
MSKGLNSKNSCPDSENQVCRPKEEWYLVGLSREATFSSRETAMIQGSRAGRYLFDSFELDAASGELRRGAERLALQPQPFKVLALLVSRDGRLVTREEIREQLWNTGTHVNFAGSLNFCLRQIRKVLREDPRCPRYIETLHRRGYRFVASVRRMGETRPAMPVQSRPRVVSPGPRQQPVRLAVLPFRELSCSAGSAFLADGITELLITYLSANPSLHVVSRTTTVRYKSSDKTLPAIARELGADRILEGAVSHSAKQVRITARLVDPSTDRNQWAVCYDAEMRDSLELQNDIASALTRDTFVQLSRWLKHPVVAGLSGFEGNAGYLEGRYYMNRRTAPDLEKAIQCFTCSLAESPDDAWAYAGLAEAYVLSYCHYGRDNPCEMYTRAKAMAHKALELDNKLAEAHAALAYCNMLSEWNWSLAERGFRKAIALNPHCVDAHQWYADLLTAVKRHDEAIEHIQLASELDPHSIQLQADVGWILLYANRHDQAIEQYRRVLEMDGDFFLAHWGLGLAYAQVGMFIEAVSSLEKAVRVTKKMPTMLAALAHVLAGSGEKDGALQMFSELRELSRRRYISAYDMATIACSLGDQGQAISWLERACGERSPYLAYFQVDSRFNRLRALSPSQRVLRRIGFGRA